MSTNASINLELPNGKFKSIYSHWDGYIEGVGAVLLENYNTTEKIEKLLGLGDVSRLGSSLEPSELTKRFGFDGIFNPEFDKLTKQEQEKLKSENYGFSNSIFYHRDRNENFEDVKAVISDKPQTQEYTYVFKNNKWYLLNSYNKYKDLKTAYENIRDEKDDNE